MKHTIISLLLVVAAGLLRSLPADAQDMRASTYCNPLNVDYTYMIYNSDKNLSYRSGADPAVVEFRGEYYMFVTRSHGYWHSTDLLNWHFITPEKWYFEGSNAPAAHNYKDSVLYVTGNPSGAMSILYTDNPKRATGKLCPPFCTTCRIRHCLSTTTIRPICFGDRPTYILSGVRSWTRTVAFW